MYINRRCACIVQTYGGPEARRAVHLVIFQSCILQNWSILHFCKVVFFQSCTFENMQFAKLIINLRAGENCDVHAMRFPVKPHTQVGYNIDNLIVMT